MGELPEDHILLKFPPRLRKNMKQIWTDGQVGISSMNMKVHLTPNKIILEEYSAAYIDTFVLEIPYAGKMLYWEVIFQDENYDYAPDFDFSDDTFLFDPDVNIITDYIPSLANWNVNNSKSLISVIREFLSLYKKFQIMKLQTENKFSRLYNEYKLLTSTEASENDVEVFIHNSGVVHFLICIKVNFSCLPLFIQPKLTGRAADMLNPNEDTASLGVSFIKPDGSKAQCYLQLSPRLEQVIGNSSVLHIPNFNKDANLLEYTSQVTELLEEKVQQIANHYKLKNEYISFLLSLCGYNVIEYDNKLFSKAIFLCEVNNFHAMLLVELGPKFPQEQPKVTLRSIYHLQHDKPFCRNLDNYPYSPRWKPEEMVKRLITFLQEEIPNFQRICQSLLQS